MKQETRNPAEIYTGLRKQVLELSPADIGVAIEPNSQTPYGILMEIGFPAGVATVTSLATGDASLYISTGGGVIGGGNHENVRTVAKAFVSTAQNYIDNMKITTSYPLPKPGQVKFYVLTLQGILGAEGDEKDLGNRKSDLSPLFYAGQYVIAELRIISEQRERM